MLPPPQVTQHFLLQAQEKANPLSLLLISESHSILYLVLHNQDLTTGSLKIPHQQAAKTNQSLHQIYNVKISAKLYSWSEKGKGEVNHLCGLHIRCPGSDILIMDRNGYSVYHQWRESGTSTAQFMPS